MGEPNAAVAMKQDPCPVVPPPPLPPAPANTASPWISASRAMLTLMLGSTKGSRSVVSRSPVGTARDTTRLAPVGLSFDTNDRVALVKVKLPVAGKLFEDVTPVT